MLAARWLFAFLMPGALLLVATVAFLQHDSFAQWIPLAARMVPFTVFGVALFLGWRFDRSRLVFAVLVLAIADRAMLAYPSTGGPIGRAVFDAVAVLVPLNLALTAILKERGLLTVWGLSRLAFLLLQPAAIALLVHYKRFDLLGVLDFAFTKAAWLSGMRPPQATLMAFVLAYALLGLHALRQRGALEIGFFWALTTVLLALFVGTPGTNMTIYLAMAGLILVVAVIEVSYGMAFRDELTGLDGRRALNQTLLKLGSRYTVAMLDIDHFKKFNDTYGHDVGDQVLRMVASRLARVTGGGKPYRYGGEEFTVLFPGKHVEDALPHLESLRSAVEMSEFMVRGKNRPRQKPAESQPKGKGKGNKKVSVTISIGVAERDERSKTAQEVIKAADKALYRAKEAGRNQVST